MEDITSSSDYLETQLDKFVFRVKRGYLYSPDDVWVTLENGQARLGITDFRQRVSGDVAFAKFPRTGKNLEKGANLCQIETIKTTIALPAPFDGALAAVNEKLNKTPELINEDPYGEGWLALMEPAGDQAVQGLLDADAYFVLMKEKLAEEDRKRQLQGGENGSA
ncbi:MAG: glycine cleavage system protein H [Chloroflexi bacterium]|nr:glycine cleavage system protein H [Chloroflexota bacterium]